MGSSKVATQGPYSPPKIVVLGSLHQLTLELKSGAHCDVTCYHHGSG